MDGIVNAASDSAINLNVILSPAWLYMSPNCCLNIYNRYKTKDIIKAWFVKDEPLYWEWGDVFAGGDHIWNQLTMGYGLLSSIDPDRLVMFNLCALDYVRDANGNDDLDKSEGSQEMRKNLMGSCESYAEYLDVLQKLFDPKVWCYDVYPISYLNADYAKIFAYPVKANTQVEYMRFYKYLSIFSRKAAETGHPFWAFGMTQAHVSHNETGNVTSGFPAPTEGMLKFEVLSALAYGAQGIVYYAFGKIESRKTNGQIIDAFEYGEAPLTWNKNDENNDDKGFTTTPVYDVVKSVNRLVNFWKDYFLGCRVLTCVHVKTSYSDKPTVTKLACVTNITVDGDGVLLSWFQNSVKPVGAAEAFTRNYIAIVNHDPFNSQNVTLQTNPVDNVKLIMTPASSLDEEPKLKFNAGIEGGISKPTKEMWFLLEPGDMRVIYWDSETPYGVPEYGD